MNVSLIIAAGGSSRRFLKGRPAPGKFSKLFLNLGGRPLLAHTLESFRGIPQIREIILAVPSSVGGVTAGTRLTRLTEPGFSSNASRIKIIAGGATRAESVWKALLKASPKNPWVLVHDGARPFPPKKEIQRMLQKPPAADGVILARPVVPTIKRVSPHGRILGTVDRSNLFEAETPQLVRRSVLLKAYRENSKALLATDEASLVESIGGRMKVHSHSSWNVKITTPEDLKLAEMYCSVQTGFPLTLNPLPLWGRGEGEGVMRVGFGRDTHRLVEGRKLYLGSVRIPFEKGALGHSDGDALLHAVADAVLGAIGSGDIGEWFSDRNPRHKNIRSGKILKKVLEEARRKGWAPRQIDSVIILERPKLGNRKKEIKKRLAQMTHLPEESISIKAKTAEGLGPEGEGLAVTCEALILMRRDT